MPIEPVTQQQGLQDFYVFFQDFYVRDFYTNLWSNLGFSDFGFLHFGFFHLGKVRGTRQKSLKFKIAIA
jgi:hypothetical protein